MLQHSYLFSAKLFSIVVEHCTLEQELNLQILAWQFSGQVKMQLALSKLPMHTQALRALQLCFTLGASLCSSRFLFFRDRSSEKRRSAPGVSKKLGRGREGVSDKGEGVGRPHPLHLLLIFRTLSQFSSPSRAFGKGKRLLPRLIGCQWIAHLKNKHKRKRNRNFTRTSGKFDSTNQHNVFVFKNRICFVFIRI